MSFREQQQQQAFVGLNCPAEPGGLQALAEFAEVLKAADS